MDQQTLYRDIALRTDGDIYIGVVGPVRTGKSTFIKRFMELLVLPNIVGEHRRNRAMDELPVSGTGRTITTTQPQFVPDQAVEVRLRDQASFRVRMIDCVGYLATGALGTQEGESARMVRTPWYDYDIPFEEAAELGTRRVIAEHATLGVIVTTDGTIADLPRGAYVQAEERVVSELKAQGKPFVLLLNSRTPEEPDALRLRDALSEKYGVPVRLLSAEDMTLADINGILEELLFEFPLTEVEIDLPRLVSALDEEHWLNEEILSSVRQAAGQMKKVRDHTQIAPTFAEGAAFDGVELKGIQLNEGSVRYALNLDENLFYQVLSEASGETIEGEEHLLALLTELSAARREYSRVAEALKSVRETGYGMVPPDQSEMTLATPEPVRQGGRFGVRLRATAPSIHLLRVDIQTEVSPIVGAEKQSQELAEFLLQEFETDPERIWTTNMFGKSLSDMVRDGLATKLMHMPGETQQKVREALGKIINEGSGGMICILL